MSGEFIHKTVLLDEAVKGLHIKPSGIYLDLTFGRGGHSAAILRELGPEGRLMAMDRDSVAVKEANTRPNFHDDRFSIEHAPFSDVTKVVSQRGWLGHVDGILMDLGVSSPQLDDASRGFSFMRDGPLDMRMDSESGISAADWLNTVEIEDMSSVFQRYGEEKFHWRFANAIAKQREISPFTTTGQLAAFIESVAPRKERTKHPATRVFQAIRIAVNNELGELETVLSQSLDLLAPGGRLCVISFHSLEDRLVKHFIREHAEADPYPSDLPIKANVIARRLKKCGGLIRPSDAQIEENPRARSARMRMAEKIQ